MESSGNSNDRHADGEFDPSADLRLLGRTKSSVGVREVLDFGPWWYAPLLAACIGGVTLFGRDVTTTENAVLGAIGLLCGGAVAWHDHRRRGVRLRPSARTAAVVVPTVLTIFVVIGAWGTAATVIGDERFVPGPAFVAWIATALLLLVVRHVMHTIRARSALA